jgi:hypothetical protein
VVLARLANLLAPGDEGHPAPASTAVPSDPDLDVPDLTGPADGPESPMSGMAELLGINDDERRDGPTPGGREVGHRR